MKKLLPLLLAACSFEGNLGHVDPPSTPDAIPPSGLPDGSEPSTFADAMHVGADANRTGCGALHSFSDVVIEGQGPIRGLAVDDAAVYYTTGGHIRRVIHNSGTAGVLSEAETAPTAIALDADRVYWVDTGKGTVRSMPKSGGTVTTLGAVGRPVDLAVDDTHVYVAAFDDESIVRIPKAGGDAVVIASGQPWLQAIAVDATHVYWASAGTPIGDFRDGAIRKIAKSGGDVVPVILNQDTTRDLDVGTDHVVFTNAPWMPISSRKGTVKRIPKLGGPATVIDERWEPVSVATFEGNVMFGEQHDGRVEIRRPGLAWGAFVYNADDPAEFQLATGPNAIWVAVTTCGTIYSIDPTTLI